MPDDELSPWNQYVVEPADAPIRAHQVRVLFSPYYSHYESSPPADRAAHIRRTIRGADFIVVSERHYQPYSRLREARPVEHAYYQRLFSGESGYRLAALFDPSPHLFGIVLNDDRAELFSKVFDHPKIWIFQRVSDAEPLPAVVPGVEFSAGT